MRKCKGIEDVSVMEVTAAEEEEEAGVRTKRATAPNLKKRKLGELSFSSSIVRLIKYQRRIAVENSTSTEVSALSSNSSANAQSSCSSSSALSQLKKQNFKAIDHLLEDEASSLAMAETSEMNDIESKKRQSSPTTREFEAESAELESGTTTQPSEEDSRRNSAPAKMPSDVEIEEFFSAAEEEIQDRFAKRYNFDFVKETPFEGRYEWIPIKPRKIKEKECSCSYCSLYLAMTSSNSSI